ncbi:MAG: WD40 repeat domain-containing protein [Anaerolineae bacterium]
MKQKRNGRGRNPYLLLGLGVLIGLFLAVIAGGVLFVTMTTITQSEIATSSVVLPTEPPIGAQGIQPTPIANQMQAVAMSPNSSHLAYASREGGNTQIYLSTLRVARNLSGDAIPLYQTGAMVDDLQFSPDGRHLFASVTDGGLWLFSVPSGELIENYSNVGGGAFSADGAQLALVERDAISLFDISTPRPQEITRRTHDVMLDTINAVTSNNADQVAIASSDRVLIYSLSNLNASPRFITPNMGTPTDLAFHPLRDHYLAMAFNGMDGQEGTVQIYDLNSTERSQYDFGTRAYAVAFSPDGAWLAIGGGESGYGEAQMMAVRWDTGNDPIPTDLNAYQPVWFNGHNHTIFDVDFTHDGYLLSTGWDGSVRLWELTLPNDAISVYYP